MRCIICNSTDKWENVDKFRLKKEGMSICKKCGFVSYPDKYKTKEEIKEYYKKDYRKPPTANNLFTGQKKLHYHEHFLREIIEKWKQEKKNPVFYDVGCAYGLFPNFMKRHFPNGDVNGSEWTESYKRVAFHEFGLRLDDEIPKDKKYDMISSYKVCEHQLDADKELELYHELLNDDGFLYISVPTWFHEFSNFGINGADIEYYYHPDHVNVWTTKHFEYLLFRSGFKIIKATTQMYGVTYLCKKTNEKVNGQFCQDYEQIKIVMDRIKKAYDLFNQQKYMDAINIYPNYPQAWSYLYESQRKTYSDLKYEFLKENIIDRALEACPNSHEVRALAGDIYLRYEKFDEAIMIHQEILQNFAPNSNQILLALGHCYRCIYEKAKDEKLKADSLREALKLYRHIAVVSDQDTPLAINWIYQTESLIEIPELKKPVEEIKKVEKKDGSKKN